MIGYFFYATEALAKLNDAIGSLPREAQNIFMNLSAEQYKLSTTLQTVDTACIHGKAREILRIFLYNYHMLPDDIKPDISNTGIIRFLNDGHPDTVRQNAYILCLNLSAFGKGSTELFIFNEPEDGKGSFLWRFIDYKHGEPSNKVADRIPTDPWQRVIYDYMYDICMTKNPITDNIINTTFQLPSIPLFKS